MTEKSANDWAPESMWTRIKITLIASAILMPLLLTAGSRYTLRVVGWAVCPDGQVHAHAESYSEKGERGIEYEYYCSVHGERTRLNPLALMAGVFVPLVIVLLGLWGLHDWAMAHANQGGMVSIVSNTVLWMLLFAMIWTIGLVVLAWFPYGIIADTVLSAGVVLHSVIKYRGRYLTEAPDSSTDG